MKVDVRYFASIREALGPGEALEVAEGATVASVRDTLIARGGAHASALARGKALRTALNKVLCDDAAVLPAGGAELAFFPPVTGG
jgi:molybdopterin synthase sulfur carrier subunit